MQKEDNHTLWAVCIGILSALACAVYWNSGIGLTDDDVRMILEAKALWATGEVPNHWPSHAGMTVALAPLSHSLILMHVFVWVCYFGLVAVVFRWAGPLAAACTALSPWVLYWAGDIMTEIPFALFSIAALWQAEKKQWVVAVLLALVSCTFRSIGVTLVGAIVVVRVFSQSADFVQEKTHIAKLCGLLGLSVVGLWWMTQTHGTIPGMSRGPYDRTAFMLSDLPGRVLSNAVTYLAWKGPPPDGEPPALQHAFLMADQFRFIWGWWYAVTAALVGASFYGLWKRRGRVVWIYLALYATALLLWPKDLAGQRYVVPVIPVLLVGLASVKVTRGWIRPSLIYIAIALISLGIRWEKGRYVPMGYQQYWALAEGLQGSPANTMIICRKSNTMRLLSGEEACLFPYTNDIDEMMAWIEGFGEGRPVLIVMDKLGYPQAERYLRPVLKAYPARFSHRANMTAVDDNSSPKTELWQYVNWKTEESE